VFSDRRDDGSDVSEDLRALEGAERGIDETLRVSFCTQPEQTPIHEHLSPLSHLSTPLGDRLAKS
jgi:hypothetical protein